MLSLHHQANHLRQANNLLPMINGAMASRPGAQQILDGNVSDAFGWGDWLAVSRNGRIEITDGDSSTDIAQAARFLRATSFQALTKDAKREDRLYIADGLNTLWYVTYDGSTFEKKTVVNSVLDENNIPYPIPVPIDVATWRNRLWIIWGENRAQHCENDQPETFDPFYTVEAQGKDPDIILNLTPTGRSLILGLRKSHWSITGDSQFNWEKDQVFSLGCGGTHSTATDGASFFVVNGKGVFQQGSADPLSDDLVEWFDQETEHAHIRIDAKNHLAYCLIFGRLFVLNTKTGKWGEITNIQASGLFEWKGRFGWYGADGAWLLMGMDEPDFRLDGSNSDVVSFYETWNENPNTNGDGRACYQRGIFVVKGSPRGNATYTVDVDEDTTSAKSYSDTFSLSDVAVDTWNGNIIDGSGEAWTVPPVIRKVTPYLAGSSFRHQVSAPCHMEITSFKPEYHFGIDE